MQQFVITKKVAKHGNQAIIVIPRFLEKHLQPKTVVQLIINVIEQPEAEQ
jgi:antitoxin component of MazEF toxin-antitoxin module